MANGEVTDDVTDGNIVADGIVQKKSPRRGKKQKGQGRTKHIKHVLC